MLDFYIAIPNYNLYSLIVHSTYILPFIVASTLFTIGIYRIVKQKKDKRRNHKLSVWKENYLLKNFDKDKQILLQKTWIDFVYSLIKFSEKWLINSPHNINETIKLLTDTNHLSTLIQQHYYLQKEFAIDIENQIKEIIQKIKLQKITKNLKKNLLQ